MESRVAEESARSNVRRLAADWLADWYRSTQRVGPSQSSVVVEGGYSPLSPLSRYPFDPSPFLVSSPLYLIAHYTILNYIHNDPTVIYVASLDVKRKGNRDRHVEADPHPIPSLLRVKVLFYAHTQGLCTMRDHSAVLQYCSPVNVTYIPGTTRYAAEPATRADRGTSPRRGRWRIAASPYPYPDWEGNSSRPSVARWCFFEEDHRELDHPPEDRETSR